jgi:hypothetical protein
MVTWDGTERRVGQYVTEEDCKEHRTTCPVSSKVFGEEGIMEWIRADAKATKEFSDQIQQELRSIDRRLSRIEFVGIGIAAAYTFFAQVLPNLIKWGQAASAATLK